MLRKILPVIGIATLGAILTFLATITIIVTLVTAAQASGARVVSNTFGCVDRGEHARIARILGQGDEKGFKQALYNSMLIGRCTVFQKGERVFIEETATFSGLIKVRKQGEAYGFWTNYEAVK